MGKVMISEHKSQTYNFLLCFHQWNTFTLQADKKKQLNTKQTKYHILQFYYHTSAET